MSDVDKYSKSDFESAKQHTEEGVEFWYARDLKDLLEYGQWRNFLNVVEKAKESCKNAKNDIGEHFADVSKMVRIGSKTKRNIDDIMLSYCAERRSQKKSNCFGLDIFFGKNKIAGKR